MNKQKWMEGLAQKISLPPERMFVIGLEKESMRASREAEIATTPHPVSLGSALTHPYITTDFAESLLELVSPPFTQIKELTRFIEQIHSHINHHIGEEIIWPASMPPIIKSVENIKIAEYGTSYPGRVRHIYRRGLALRYGKIMQTIAGIHFNFSFSDDFLMMRQELFKEKPSKSDIYFHIMRNYIRLSWIVNYLFGASPLVDKSFLQGRPAPSFLKPFGKSSYIHLRSTCLRMSRLGYTNLNQDALQLCFNRLDDYLDTMTRMLTSVEPRYLKAGVKVNGDYKQLNANRLQVENEYYSSIRPKAQRSFTEKTIDVLVAQGVEYLEIRNLDLNPFLPHGIDEEQLLFLQLLLCYCSLMPSPDVDIEECRHIRSQDEMILMNNMEMEHQSHKTLKEKGMEILQSMEPLAEALENSSLTESPKFFQALRKQQDKFTNQDMLPAKQLVNYMQKNKWDFVTGIAALAEEHKKCYAQLSQEQQDGLAGTARESIKKQEEMEKANLGDFDAFMENYLSIKNLEL